jgi:hypothetical protein
MDTQDDDPKDVPRPADDSEAGNGSGQEAHDEASEEDFDPQKDPAYNPDDEGLKGIKGG